ncbi:MAG TPA: lytic murein transglycosylase B [Eoetvoesiella sp.]
MFKPARVLQVAAVFTLLAGCASTQPAARSANTPVQTSSNPGGQPAVLKRLADASPIQAGSSINSAEGFQDSDGRLKKDIEAYAREVSKSRQVPLDEVESLLKTAQYNATVAKLMAPAKTRIRRSWITYRKRFVEPVRIKSGLDFWSENRAVLDKTAAQFGVPASIIVAIIGVETVYGRNTGSFLVLDALATLGFRNPDPARPERSQLFRDQLADLIELDHFQKLDARKVTGSFAGAMGLPQFMPGSLLRFAVDGDNDKRIDLSGSAADAIASVANFLRVHGWQPGLPVFAPVTLPANPAKLVAGGLEPSYDWAQLRAKGATSRPGASPAKWQQHRVGVIDLLDEPRNLEEYRTGTPNFFAITHYNRSYFYAASVADLAQALADRMGVGGPN